MIVMFKVPGNEDYRVCHNLRRLILRTFFTAVGSNHRVDRHLGIHPVASLWCILGSACKVFGEVHTEHYCLIWDLFWHAVVLLPLCSEKDDSASCKASTRPSNVLSFVTCIILVALALMGTFSHCQVAGAHLTSVSSNAGFRWSCNKRVL